MADPFVDPGFVDTGFVEDFSLPFSNTNQHMTDFREYARGRLPSDWIPQWTDETDSRVEGATYDLQHRNCLLYDSPLATSRNAIAWTAPDQDTGHENQEIRFRFRVLLDNSGAALRFVIRGSGTTGAENGYRLVVVTSGMWQLTRLSAGAESVLQTVALNITLGTFYNGLLRIEDDGTIHAKLWPYGYDEPLTWDAEDVDPSPLSDGWMGISGPGAYITAEVYFFSAATDGQSAPLEEDLDESLDTWISEPDERFEVTVRCEYYDPALDDVADIWFSSLGRKTTSYDYPPNTILHPLLLSAGSLSSRLEADAHLGGAAIPTRDSIRLNNLPYYPGGPGLLDSWPNLSFFGRPVEVRLGKRWYRYPTPYSPGVLSLHRRFELVGCAVISQEPDVGTEEVTLSVESGIPRDNRSTTGKLLTDRLLVNYNVGISTGVRALTSTAYISVPAHTSYDITSFCIYLRVLIPVSGVTGSITTNLSRRELDATHQQWLIGLQQVSHADPHTILIRSRDVAGNLIIDYMTEERYNLDGFVDIIVGIRGSNDWYLAINGSLVTSDVLTADPAPLAGTPIHFIIGDATGLTICDHRIEQWLPSDMAIARFSTRSEPDNMNISMHRCDDASGSTVTDYNLTTANDATVIGVENTDWEWSPTYLGSVEVTGTPMPISGGVLFHAPTQNVDPVRNIFRFNDSAKSVGAELELRDQGYVLASPADYTEPSEGLGTADLTGPASQPVTYGLTPTTPEEPECHVPLLALNELTSRGLATFATCDQDSYRALRQLLPLKGGFHYDDPPTVEEFLSSLLSPLASHYTLDRSGRLSAGCLLPPLNPGPYGQEPLLEFTGSPNRGVTFSPNSIFDLDDVLAGGSPWFGLACWIKVPLIYQDKSCTLGDYLPTGMTIIDRIDDVNGAGYYLGLDGRDGSIVFGAPGVISVDTGFHYLSYHYPLLPGHHYFIACYQDSNTRSITVYDRDTNLLTISGEDSELTTGGMTPAVDSPLRIGHGPRGSFCGWIGYIIGSSSALSQSDWIDNLGLDAFNIRSTRWGEDNVSSLRWSLTQFYIPMIEGSGDLVTEQKSGFPGLITGARWCPRLTLDLRKRGSPTLAPIRCPVPAWRLEGQYHRNYRPLTITEMSASLTDSEKLELTQAYLSKPSEMRDIKDKYKNSQDIINSSPLLDPVDTETISHLLLDRVSRGRRFATVNNWPQEHLKLNLTDEILVYHDRFELDEGRPMRVAMLVARLLDIGNSADIDRLLGDIMAWG